MRYRMEVLKDELVIRNVETDLVLGNVQRHCIADPHDPDCRIMTGCTVFNNEGEEIATIPSTDPRSLECAAVAIANHEAHYGYPGLKNCAKNPDPYRVEWLLGKVLADAVAVIARALIEQRDGGLKTETKSKWAGLCVQLHNIWYAGRFGSFDGERRVTDPYFASGSDQRVGFAAAAQRYGMFELQMRFPDVSDTMLKEALSWPLYLLSDTLNRLLPRKNPPQLFEKARPNN